MKTFSTLFCLCLLSILPTALPISATEDVTLTGSFVWTRAEGDESGDLTAVFTSGDEGQWNVEFHFVWDDQDQTYLGIANGNLEAGSLTGTARDDQRDLSFRFEGAFENGTFQGSHAFVKDDGTTQPGGTLTLSR